MKRDPDLIRQILLSVEEKNNLDQLFPTNLGITGWDNADIDYHALLLIEAGYLEGKATPMGQGNVMVVIKRLTWESMSFWMQLAMMVGGQRPNLPSPKQGDGHLKS
ncbi:DUF2513 domain-containing protein [Candidatus Parcubacteria bacterium]|jgi:hypothetical protein|nr:MAG: DUF2513 domain-containing protein [Candidatus Parcubacteria bacterium]